MSARAHWGTALAVLAAVASASVSYAEEEAGPRTQAVFLIEGMTSAEACPPQVKKALEGAGVSGVTVDFETCLATVTFDPSKTTVSKILASLARKRKYRADLQGVETLYDVGIGTWALSTDRIAFSPGQPGKLNLTFTPKGGSISGLRIEWKSEAGVAVTPVDKGSDAVVSISTMFICEFVLPKDVTKSEMTSRVVLTYTGKDDAGQVAKARIELPGVIVMKPKK